MLEHKSEPNNGWDDCLTQSLNSGNLFNLFPVQTLDNKEVKLQWN